MLSDIPDTTANDVPLVDDFEGYIHPGQEPQWVQVDCFDYPYDQSDTGLIKVFKELERRLDLSGN